MNGELRSDIAALEETVRRFARKRIAPNAQAWDEAGDQPAGVQRVS